MAIRMSSALQNYLLGSGSLTQALAFGVIEVYTGSQPASADDAPTGTLLGKVTESGAAFTHGAAENGLLLTLVPQYNYVVASFSQTWVLSPVATGLAGWWRFKANAADDNSMSVAHVRLDGAIEAPYSEFYLEEPNLVAGQLVTLDSFQIGFNN